MGKQKALLYIAQETYNIQYSVKKYNGKEEHANGFSSQRSVNRYNFNLVFGKQY